MRGFSTGLFVVYLVLAASLGAAQNRAQEIVISGVVTDASGSLVPNASVLLLALDGKRLANTESDAAGLFHVPAHGTGERRLEIQHLGFKPFVTRLHVSQGNAKPVKAVLEIADYVQNVDVTSDSDAAALSTDPAENRDAAVVTSDSLEHLPVFDQDYVSALANFLDQGSVGTEGATIVVDGMEQKDAGVTASAVESVKVNNDPYSAEYSRPGRGRIEITTKSPDPVYHGTFNFILRDYHLDARNPFASARPPEQRRIFEGVLTGRVPKISKTFFLLSADYQLDDVQSTLVAQLPTGILQENVPSPIRAIDGAARLTHDISDTHNVTLQITYEGRKRSNQLASPGQNLTAAQTPGSGGNGGGGGSAQTQVLGGYVLPEAGQNLSGVERHLTFTDKLVLSASLLNQLQVMYEHNRDSTASTTEAPQINVQNTFVSGGAQATQLNTENNIDIRDTLTWSHQKHTVVAGFAMPNMSRRALDDYSNRLGTFSFTSLQNYVAGHPYSFTQQQGPVHFIYWQREIGGFVQDQIRLSPVFQMTVGVRWDWQNYLHDDDNFAPRVSFAYALGRERKTVLRAGAGIFYDRTSARPIANLALYSEPALTSILILNPSYPDPFAGGVSSTAPPANLYRLSPSIRTPYSILYSATLERRITKTATVAATYRGSVGVALFETLNVNQPTPPFYLTRPDLGYGVFREVQSNGRQVSQALDLSFSGKLNRYLSGIAQYTLSRTNNNTGGINYMPPNTYNLSGEWGRAAFDQRQRLNVLMSSSIHKWVELGFGLTAASGLPYTLTLGQDIYNSGFATARPPGVSRNTLQGPGYVELDLRWSHDFFLSKKAEKGPIAGIAVDAFNLPNRVNFAQFVGNESSPFFGQAVAALPARRLQFTLRFKF
jgi:Carboxypeptidase regulatory-like domain